jgi:hypothetical protein
VHRGAAQEVQPRRAEGGAPGKSIIIKILNMLMPVQQNRFTHPRVLLVRTDRGILLNSSALRYKLCTPHQCVTVHICYASSVHCGTHLPCLVSASRCTFAMPRQCVTMHICHASSVRCGTHLSRLVSASRYTFVTPR